MSVKVFLPGFIPLISDGVIAVESFGRIAVIQKLFQPVDAVAVGVVYLILLRQRECDQRFAQLLAVERADLVDLVRQQPGLVHADGAGVFFRDHRAAQKIDQAGKGILHVDLAAKDFVQIFVGQAEDEISLVIIQIIQQRFDGYREQGSLRQGPYGIARAGNVDQIHGFSVVSHLGGIGVFHIIQNASGAENGAENILGFQVVGQIFHLGFLHPEGDVHIQVAGVFYAADPDGHIHIALPMGIDPFVQIEGAGVLTCDPYCPAIVGKSFSFRHICTSSKRNLA